MPPFIISSAFDSGNISCLSADSSDNIQLEILKDHNSDFYQWFYFRLSGARDQECKLHITNASGSAYTKGWTNYKAVASENKKDWRRIKTNFIDGVLTFEYTPKTDSVWFAYFAPYTTESHNDLIAMIQQSTKAKISVLGKTLDGQDIDLVRIGEEGPNKRVCWIIARQHPGESMAEWWMEGLLERLIFSDDNISAEILEKIVFYLIPNMNPDGTKRGHLRTNAAGTNLNREWLSPSMARSPEVFLVRKKMLETVKLSYFTIMNIFIKMTMLIRLGVYS